jgi:small-conductance mechanosensitive channel
VLAPFDVGDRVNISTIASGSTSYVHRINLLTTEFRDIRGKMYIARNSDLTSQTILNQRRSQEATFDPVVWLDEHLTAHDFKKLEAWIKEFLRRNPLDWKPGLFIAVGVAEPNRVTLTFWVTHRKSWQDASSIWPAYSQFMYEVVAVSNTPTY